MRLNRDLQIENLIRDEVRVKSGEIEVRLGIFEHVLWINLDVKLVTYYKLTILCRIDSDVDSNFVA